MIKKTLIFLLISSLIWGFTGCARVSSSDQKVNRNPDDQVPNNVVVTDSSGRQVSIPGKVNRIACLYAFSGDMVTMLGKGQDIVAVVDGLKRDVLLNQINPQIKQASVPVTTSVINIEELLKAKPDLAFVSKDTAANESETNKLRTANIPYLVVDFNSLKEQENAILMIGQAIGEAGRARQYVDYYQASIERVQAKIKDIPLSNRIRVYHSVNEAARTDPPNSLPTDWLHVAGAISVSANANLKLVDGNKYFAGLEQIILWNPQVILANEPGIPEYILSNSQWANIAAVKNKRVYQMPNGLSRWGHPGGMETPLAILWTAKTLYPDLFSDLDIDKEAKSFYQKCFNYSITDDMLSRILKGENMRTPRSK